MVDDTLNPDELRARINNETGKIGWQELQPHFARGVVIHVAPGMDLVNVAVCLARDDRASFERWLCEGTVARVDEHLARDWVTRTPVFWAVVVAPWVLVQEAEQTPSIN